MDSNPGLWASQSVPLTSCQLPPLRLTPRPTRLQREKWTLPSLPVTSPPLPPGPSSSISGIWSSEGFADSLALFKVLQQACLLSPCFRESLLTAQGAASWGNWKAPDISQSTVATGLPGNASGIRPACTGPCTERPLDLRSWAGWGPGWLLGCGV